MTREEQIEQAWFCKALLSSHCYDEKSFKEAAQWADKTMIEKACEYLRTHLWQNTDDDNDPIVESVHNITLDNFIKDFKRYLGE